MARFIMSMNRQRPAYHEYEWENPLIIKLNSSIQDNVPQNPSLIYSWRDRGRHVPLCLCVDGSKAWAAGRAGERQSADAVAVEALGLKGRPGLSS